MIATVELDLVMFATLSARYRGYGQSGSNSRERGGNAPHLSAELIVKKHARKFNPDASDALAGGWKVGVSVFNLLDNHDEAADYYHTSRLPNEPADGVTRFRVHPLEPRSLRITLTKSFQ